MFHKCKLFFLQFDQIEQNWGHKLSQRVIDQGWPQGRKWWEGRERVAEAPRNNSTGNWNILDVTFSYKSSFWAMHETGSIRWKRHNREKAQWEWIKEQIAQVEPWQRRRRRRMWPNPAWQICFRGQRARKFGLNGSAAAWEPAGCGSQNVIFISLRLLVDGCTSYLRLLADWYTSYLR